MVCFSYFFNEIQNKHKSKTLSFYTGLNLTNKCGVNLRVGLDCNQQAVQCTLWLKKKFTHLKKCNNFLMNRDILDMFVLSDVKCNSLSV